MAYGVVGGVLCYLLLNGIPFIISRDRILPVDYEFREEWAIPPGSMAPTWLYVHESFFVFLQVTHSYSGSRHLIEYTHRHDGVEERRIVLEDITKHGKAEGNQSTNSVDAEVV